VLELLGDFSVLCPSQPVLFLQAAGLMLICMCTRKDPRCFCVGRIVALLIVVQTTPICNIQDWRMEHSGGVVVGQMIGGAYVFILFLTRL
jgi:hypothetical protein